MTCNEIDHKRLRELAQELKQFMHSIQGLYLDSIVGYKLINNQIEKDQSVLKEFLRNDPELATDEFQDSLSFQHCDIYGKEFSASAIHSAKKGEVKKRNKNKGINHNLIATTCIVMMYSYWEHYFRVEVSKAYSISEIKDDFWGDMRWLRHDILHNKNRCKESQKAKILTWFKSGEEIVITQEKMGDVFLNILRYSCKLHGDSIKKIVMKIPKEKHS